MTYRERQIRSIQQKQALQYEAQIEALKEELERKRGKKQTYKGELGKVEKELDQILKKWQFGDVPFKNAEEFLEKFEEWINEQLERKKTWKELLEKYEAKDLKELAQKLDQSQQNHLNYLQELQDKQELEFRYKELEIERKNWLVPYLSKIESLETQLFNLAKQKLTSQKEGKKLLKQLNEKHEKDREWWSSELAKSKQFNSELKKDYKNQLIKQAEEHEKREEESRKKIAEQEGVIKEQEKITPFWREEKQKLTKEIKELTDLKTNQGNIIREQNKQLKGFSELEQQNQQLTKQLSEITACFDRTPSSFVNHSTLLNFFKEIATDVNAYRLIQQEQTSSSSKSKKKKK